jgi:hypothetical protein
MNANPKVPNRPRIEPPEPAPKPRRDPDEPRADPAGDPPPDPGERPLEAAPAALQLCTETGLFAGAATASVAHQHAGNRR